MKVFDLLGPLPSPNTTTVVEASAGTGKTFALAGLVTRLVAEGAATLDQMLLITFGRAASQELRERVRDQIVCALAALTEPTRARNDLETYLIAEDRDARRQRLRDALAGFDAATIATTHQFCQIVLKSLGVAGDSDSGVTLVESLDDLVCEIVDDLYLSRFGAQKDHPLLDYAAALRLARTVVANPATELRPTDPDPDSPATVRLNFARDVLAELEIRKRRRGVLGYDDLLTRLATALTPRPPRVRGEAPDSPARVRMHQRWPIVMVDEFQDTDPVQWQVIERAFSGHSTLILIGDPKQAIYAFRGGDIDTYLRAAATAGDKQTLGTNWRSDSALVDRLQVVLRGAQLGGSDIVVHDVKAHHQGHRLAGAPRNDPFRLRVVSRNGKDAKTIPIDRLRTHIGRDLAADIGALLTSGATFDGRPVQARDIAVITETHKDARACHNALLTAGIPAVYTGDSDVFNSEAAEDWLYLLEAFDQPHRTGLVRAAAATMFFGETAESLAAGGDALTDRIADTLRTWAGQARERGVAAIFEAAQLAGMSRRVLSWQGGERLMTDLAHMTQLLGDTAHREGFGLPALRDWLRTQRSEGGGESERNRRLDSDAAAVQIMTVWVSKGLQYPIVYLPFTFNRYVPEPDLILFHDDGVRCLHIGGADPAVARAGRAEAAADDSRLTYVAMTRAQSQVVAWWAPSRDEPNGGLSRLLRGRGPGESAVPDKCTPIKIGDADALDRLRAWEAAGGPVIEESVVEGFTPVPAPPPAENLATRHFHRAIDTSWRRTSYSGLLRAADDSGVTSEPEVTELDDEVNVVDDVLVVPTATGIDVPSPMAMLPTGAAFGSLVHAVLETADPFAADLGAELATQVRTHAARWPVEVEADELAAALVPMHDTPLGPLAPGMTLRQIGLRDRLRELDFEFPMAGGDLRAGTFARLSDVGALLRTHLPADDPMAPYAQRLSGGVLGNQPLRGYLSGSVDAVLRIGSRFVVVDYKTNWLGTGDAELTAADYTRDRMAEAMLHSDYPLQALLYSVVLHRFLNWRLPGYDPATHLGGVMYLFVRGMCGAATPVVDGHPAGVFSWEPPAALVVAVSELLDA
ncbi:exodeoxyribonuclease V subunit beta [Mycobacterium sp. 852013-50091_SCH5140682]|uniref:exodeoxyribonuclease V subunit beta n=1 Tax=Mycobacterium sp. 852013-50091_SCH5140682 TaxID=1834109 RepID=UPI0007EA67CD|nr:exodeoxyribonuclease V subunit beta [Mycobacterium sp. 852013-50091_SCH5140682]OBC04861.1 exodeoxyribonuclease V subunit beta [Mycobacterium sp. 852013-50091_SCH5140682]